MKRIFGIFIILILLVGCSGQIVTDNKQKQSTQDPLVFDNVDDLQDYLEDQDIEIGKSGFYLEEDLKGVFETTTTGAKSPDYSQTNNQYGDVDEADFVKTDGEYIYVISKNKLLFIDSKTDKKISEIDIDSLLEKGYGKDIFVDGNKLVLFVEFSENSIFFSKYSIFPLERYEQRTKAFIYNIADKENPLLVSEFEFSGAYSNARLIDGRVYLVTQEQVTEGPIFVQPFAKGSFVIEPKIYFFDSSGSSYRYNTVSSVDLKSDSLIDSKTFMIGYSDTLMISKDNIYIAYKKGYNYEALNQDNKERFYKAIYPLLIEEIKNKIDYISNELNDDEEWQKINEILVEVYQGQGFRKTPEYEEMLKSISKALEKYDIEKELDKSKTIIHKLGIKNGLISYDSKGEIEGTLINQFSMDETEGFLRVATTINVWLEKRIQYNQVAIFDSNMKVIGKTGKVAEGERIYSTRFMGDKLYMVTFKQTDPFFVVDLTNPTNPYVEGELKLPGFSDYLHPYGNNYIIGIGQETSIGEYDNVVIEGVKISLFDVSDYSNPKIIDSRVIGKKGSRTAISRDHKAFLIDASNGLVFVPVDEVLSLDYGVEKSVSYGLNVLKISEKGFELVGKVIHEKTHKQTIPWHGENSIKRSLYIGNKLYSFSAKQMKVNNINNLEELKTLSF